MKRTAPEHRCGYTKESARPSTLEIFINQCTKEAGHTPPHLFETKDATPESARAPEGWEEA